MMENNVSIGEQKEKCAKARNVCGIKSVLMGLDEKVQRVVSRQMREVSETTKKIKVAIFHSTSNSSRNRCADVFHFT